MKDTFYSIAVAAALGFLFLFGLFMVIEAIDPPAREPAPACRNCGTENP